MGLFDVRRVIFTILVKYLATEKRTFDKP